MTIQELVSAAASWPVASQQRACRNALVASTALMERRRERIEVEEFLASMPTQRVERSA